MKEKLQRFLQKVLGYDNYLYWFARVKTSFFKGSTYEAEFFEFLNLVPAGTILDIGANIGITTVPIAQKFPQQKLHSFEPIPSNCRALKLVVEHYKINNVTLHEVALGEQPGELKLVVPVINGVRMQGLSHAYVEGNTDDWNKGEIHHIPMLKLDEIQALQREEKIAAIKIDVENFEYYVLKGGRKLLEKHHPVIYCELWENEMRQPVMGLLKEIGYKVKVFEGKNLVDYNGQKGTNFIFVY